MILDLLTYAFVAWLCWAAWLSLLMLYIRWQGVPGADIYVVGLIRPKIFIKPSLVSQVTSEELDGLVMHELGHCALGHLLKNYLRALVLPFTSRSRSTTFDQEIEADLWAAERGRGRSLASALRKLSPNSKFDNFRAAKLDFEASIYELQQSARLLEQALTGQREAGDPPRGTRGEVNIREG